MQQWQIVIPRHYRCCLDGWMGGSPQGTYRSDHRDTASRLEVLLFGDDLLKYNVVTIDFLIEFLLPPGLSFPTSDPWHQHSMYSYKGSFTKHLSNGNVSSNGQKFMTLKQLRQPNTCSEIYEPFKYPNVRHLGQCTAHFLLPVAQKNKASAGDIEDPNFPTVPNGTIHTVTVSNKNIQHLKEHSALFLARYLQAVWLQQNKEERV